MTIGRSQPLDPAALTWAQTTVLFRGLAAADVARLLAGATVDSGPDGLELFVEGTAADRFFLVMDGHVELCAGQGERVSVVEIAGAHALLGESALFLGRHGHSARVVGYARVLAVPAEPFLALLGQRCDIAQRLLGAMSRSLRGLINQIAALKLKTTAQRLGGFLLGLANRDEGEAVVRFPFDKRLAAESLGMTAESLSRALTRLAPLGVESRPDNRVAIADLGALRAFCGEEEGA